MTSTGKRWKMVRKWWENDSEMVGKWFGNGGHLELSEDEKGGGEGGRHHQGHHGKANGLKFQKSKNLN